MEWKTIQMDRHEEKRLYIPDAPHSLRVFSDGLGEWSIVALGRFVPPQPTEEKAKEAALNFARNLLDEWRSHLT